MARTIGDALLAATRSGLAANRAALAQQVGAFLAGAVHAAVAPLAHAAAGTVGWAHPGVAERARPYQQIVAGGAVRQTQPQHTQHVTVHAPITVNGATDPTAVGREINRALSELVGGVRASRRLAG